MKETWLTPEAHERLKAELQELETTGREEIRLRILEARELGDLRENAEYDQAKEDQAFLEARIRDLTELLRHSRVGSAPIGERGVVGVGTKVRLRDRYGDEDVYVFTSPENKLDDDELILLSPGSPLGEALNGKRAGDTVSYHAPGGDFTVEVLTVEPI